MKIAQRLLLGTLPPEKKAWEEASRKSRDNYYVGVLANLKYCNTHHRCRTLFVSC